MPRIELEPLSGERAEIQGRELQQLVSSQDWLKDVFPTSAELFSVRTDVAAVVGELAASEYIKRSIIREDGKARGLAVLAPYHIAVHPLALEFVGVAADYWVAKDWALEEGLKDSNHKRHHDAAKQIFTYAKGMLEDNYAEELAYEQDSCGVITIVKKNNAYPPVGLLDIMGPVGAYEPLTSPMEGEQNIFDLPPHNSVPSGNDAQLNYISYEHLAVELAEM
jgi:hypothetical protein